MGMLPASLPRGRKHKWGAAKPFNVGFLPGRGGQTRSRDHAGNSLLSPGRLPLPGTRARAFWGPSSPHDAQPLQTGAAAADRYL